jgi:hypothetical protein
VCERAIYIEHGQVQHEGPSGEVIDLYNQILEKRRIEKMGLSHGSVEAGEQVEITKMDVIDGEGSPVTEVYGDQPIEIRVHYTSYQDIGKANAIVRIYRSDGLSVCVLRTHLDGFPVVLEKGQGSISVRLEPSQLFGGMYYAIAWMMNAEDADGIAYGASDWFEVKNRASGREAHDSVFEPDRTWSHSVNARVSLDRGHKLEMMNDRSSTTTS